MSCTDENDSRKILRLSNSKPIITQGSTTLMEFNEGDLSSFFQVISSYMIQTIVLPAGGGTSLINQNMNFIMIKTAWPLTTLESEKSVELQLSDFDYGNVYTGATGTIESAGTTVTGATTDFTNYSAGDRIESGGQIRTIDAIGSTVSLTTTVAFSPAIAIGSTFSTVTYDTTLGATALQTEKMPFKDLFMINAIECHDHIKLTNQSIHTVTISLLTAKT